MKYRDIENEPLLEGIQTLIGALSDFAVHFTPEHLGGYDWSHCTDPEGVRVSYERSAANVHGEALMLAGQHRLIHCVFDRYFDGAIRGCRPVQENSAEAMGLLRQCFEELDPGDPVEKVEDWFDVLAAKQNDGNEPPTGT